MFITKRDGMLQEYNPDKIRAAVYKAFNEMGILAPSCIDARIDNLTFNDGVGIETIQDTVVSLLRSIGYPQVAENYAKYRKVHAAMRIFHDVGKKIDELNTSEDRSNANSNSNLTSTKKMLVLSEYMKGLYKEYYLTKEERKAVDDGFIYIHDIGDRLMCSFNCMLFNVGEILKGGFTLENIDYTEPGSVDVALRLINDVLLCVSGNSYGGITIPQIDEVLIPYCEKSYDKFTKEWDDYFSECSNPKISREDYAIKKITRDIEQGFQGIEYSWNSLSGSRGSFAFTTLTFGHSTNRWATLVSSIILKTRKEGQGRPGKKVPVLFPKLVFIYDSELHGESKELEWLFKEAVECTKVTQYPDYLSVDAGYLGDTYHKWDKIISPMGCRSFLSPMFRKSGTWIPQDDDDEFLIYRCNLGVISMNLPMMVYEAKIHNKDWKDVLDYYMEMVRAISKKVIKYVSKMKASCNPLVFCEGGLDGGHLNMDDTIESVLKYSTISFGYGGLHEVNMILSGKPIYENSDAAYEVACYIRDKINLFKEEDKIAWAFYSSPGESWLSVACDQFKKKYGEVPSITNNGYWANSFHVPSEADLTPIEKLQTEERFWEIPLGGRIMYCRTPVVYNTKAITDIIRLAMSKGMYYGVNHAENHCPDCGHHWVGNDESEETCQKCGSGNIVKIRRMNVRAFRP